MGFLNTLRDHIYNQIVEDQGTDPSPYGALANFNIERKWVPYERMEAMTTAHPEGKLYLIGTEYDDSVISRGNAAEVEIGVMMGFQKSGISIHDNDILDNLVDLKEEIRTSVRKVDPDGYSYLRTESLKDDDTGLPFSLATLRSGQMFEAIWVSYFKAILPPAIGS
jgi:hypothetical protein